MADNLNWISLGPLIETSTDFSAYSKDIGLYRAILDGVVVYIGKATELHNGGLRKRLRDYTRLSQSARNYQAGSLMHKHKNEIIIEIILFERDLKSIPAIEAMEKELINKMKPAWNTFDKER